MAADLQPGIALRQAGATLCLAALALLVVGAGTARTTGGTEAEHAVMVAQNEPSQEEPVSESPASEEAEEPMVDDAPAEDASVDDSPVDDLPAGDPDIVDDPPDPDNGDLAQEPGDGAECQTITVRVGADTCETLCRQYLACPGQANESLFCVPGPC